MISPLENSGMLLRTQDFSSIRQNENNQGALAHSQIQSELDKTEDVTLHSVVKQDDADKSDTRHDARQEGRNKYYDMRKKKKAEPDLSEGIVVKKSPAKFDISI